MLDVTIEPNASILHTPKTHMKDRKIFGTPNSAQAGIEQFGKLLKEIVRAKEVLDNGVHHTVNNAEFSSPCGKSRIDQRGLRLARGRSNTPKLSPETLIQLQSMISRMTTDTASLSSQFILESDLAVLVRLCENTLGEVDRDLLSARIWSGNRKRKHLLSSDAESDDEDVTATQEDTTSQEQSYCSNLDDLVSALDAVDIVFNLSRIHTDLAQQVLQEAFLVTVIDTLRRVGESILFVRLPLSLQESYESFIESKKLGSKFHMIAARMNVILEHFISLTEKESLSDSTTIKLVYLFIHPLTFAPTSLDIRPLISTAILDGIQKSCLRLLENTYGKQTSQRTFIVREVLMRADKSVPSFYADLSAQKLALQTGGFQLNDKQTIQVTSAIFLHIWQATYYSQPATVSSEKTDGIPLLEFRNRLVSTQREVNDCCSTVLRYLLEGAFKEKSRGSESEFAFRHILSNLITDMLLVLENVNYPVSHLSLFILTTLLYEYLDKPHIDLAHRSTILEYLGDIASRIRKFAVAVSKFSTLQEWKTIEIGNSITVDAFENILNHQKSVIKYLTEGKLLNTTSNKYSIFAMIGGWARLLYPFWYESTRKVYSSPVIAIADSAMQLYERWSRQIFVNNLKSSDLEISQDVDGLNAYRDIAVHSPLYITSGKTLFYIFETLQDSKQVSIMTRSIRELKKIINVDPSTLGQEQFRDFMHELIRNDSPAVRDTATDFLGSYVVIEKDYIPIYYPLIRTRLHDSSLAVRKRVVKLLRDIYSVAETSFNIKKEIAGDLIYCSSNDADLAIRDLCIKMIIEIWFSYTEQIGADARLEDLSHSLQSEIQARMNVICSMVQQGISLELLADLFTKVVAKTKQAISIMSTCIEIGIEALTSNGEEKELQNLMVLNPFCLACPDRAASHYDILLAYIKSPAGQRTDSGRDKATRMTYLVLPMIISIIPFTIEPDPARFTTTLETLYNVIHSTGVTIVSLAVQCLVVIIEKLGKSYDMLTNLFQKHVAHLQQWRTKLESEMILPSGMLSRDLDKSFHLTVLRPLYLVGCLAHQFDFDQFCSKYPEELKNIPKPIHQYVFDLLGFYCNTDKLGQKVLNTAVESLCLLILSTPLMLMESRSVVLLKRIFEHASRDNYSHGDLKNVTKVLQFLHDFCEKESDKMSAAQLKRSKHSLFGQKEEQEMGAASTTIQQYLDKILPMLLLDKYHATQKAALNIVVLALEQGMVHPTTCSPYILASATSHNEDIAEVGLATFTSLYTKYLSLIKAKTIEGVEMAFILLFNGYGNARGIACDNNGRGNSALHAIYALIRTNRLRRKDFLQSLVKSSAPGSKLRSKLAMKTSEVAYSRFVCEILCSLEYKMREEVFIILNELEQIWVTLGSEVMQNLETNNGVDEHLFEIGCVYSMLLVLQRHLQEQYGISDSLLQQFETMKKGKSLDKPVSKLSLFPPKWIPTRLNEDQIDLNLFSEEERRLCISEILVFAKTKNESLDFGEAKSNRSHTSSCEEDSVSDIVDESDDEDFKEKTNSKKKRKTKRAAASKSRSR